MPGKVEKLIIGKDGVARGIHGPLVATITAKLGEVRIMRASHVEPGSELSQAALAVTRAMYLDLDRCAELPDGRRVFYIHRDYAAKWFADMEPTGYEVVLGPYSTREEALAEEVKWLTERNIPVCHSCRESGT